MDDMANAEIIETKHIPGADFPAYVKRYQKNREMGDNFGSFFALISECKKGNVPSVLVNWFNDGAWNAEATLTLYHGTPVELWFTLPEHN